MVSFRERFERDFRSTKNVKDLTVQFKRTNPEEFERIKKRMERFK